MKVFVGLPIFNLIDSKVKENQDAIFKQSNHNILFSQVIGASVEHARSILIERFLQTDCEYYFTLDADILYLGDFDPINRLISLDKDIIGGIYVYKKKPCLPVFRPLDLQEEYEKTEKFPDNYKFKIENEPFEVNWIGNGFKLIKRKVVEEIRKIIKVPNLPMIYKEEYVSEDWAMDQRARELGFKVFADPKIKLLHRGSYDYSLEDYERYN